MSQTMEPKAKKVKKENLWTREVLLKFFEVFEQYPCLYDTKNKFYLNKHARADAISKIVEHLGIEIKVEEVKTKINNIRSQLSHEMKKIRDKPSGAGSDEVSEPVWWFDNVQFLVPHLKSRKGKDSLDNIIEESPKISDEENTGIITDIDENSSMTPKTYTSRSGRFSTKENDKDSGNFSSYTKTLETLKVLNERIINSSHTEKREVREAVFGAYVAEELLKIGNVEMVCDAKHEISNILYQCSKKYVRSQTQILEFDFD
ncbi:hypothetical protein ABEB36_014637 [Hypothenemus hampei]|uniref:MADF domain-containing protein n=1 Tax=Hypothenemus hampei TaxID=57062 RepID=A0ABD1E2D8_HYPHA